MNKIYLSGLLILVEKYNKNKIERITDFGMILGQVFS